MMMLMTDKKRLVPLHCTDCSCKCFGVFVFVVVVDSDNVVVAVVRSDTDAAIQIRQTNDMWGKETMTTTITIACGQQNNTLDQEIKMLSKCYVTMLPIKSVPTGSTGCISID